MLYSSVLVATLMLSSGDSAELLAFHSAWSEPCQIMQPKIRRLAKSGCTIREVDFDTCRELACRYSVNQIPTYVMLLNGCEVARVSGVVGLARLKAMFPPKLRVAGEKPSFEVGDVVGLRSGGPLMTIVAQQEGSQSACRCIWFGRRLQVEAGWFPVRTLLLVNPCVQEASGGGVLPKTWSVCYEGIQSPARAEGDSR